METRREVSTNPSDASSGQIRDGELRGRVEEEEREGGGRNSEKNAPENRNFPLEHIVVVDQTRRETLDRVLAKLCRRR